MLGLAQWYECSTVLGMRKGHPLPYTAGIVQHAGLAVANQWFLFE